MERIGRTSRNIPSGKAPKSLKTVKWSARIHFVISRSCVRVTPPAPKGDDNLDILSGTLRVPGGRALFLSLFLNVFLLNGWGNRNRVRPAAAIRFALFRAEAELEN